MTRVRVRDSNKEAWHSFRDLMTLEMDDQFTQPTLLDSKLFIHAEGTEESPQLSETRYLPGVVIELHAHHVDEIFYIVGGAMHLGSRVLGAGCSIFIPRDTLYGFTAGPEGVHLLNFRPHFDLSYVSKEAYEQLRSGRRTTAPEKEMKFSYPGAGA